MPQAVQLEITTEWKAVLLSVVILASRFMGTLPAFLLLPICSPRQMNLSATMSAIFMLMVFSTIIIRPERSSSIILLNVLLGLTQLQKRECIVIITMAL